MFIHINRSNPPEPVSTVSEPSYLWCFGCRKRLPHILMVITGEYYDPEFFWYCTRCKESNTEFPR